MPGENTADGVALQIISILLEEVQTIFKEISEDEVGQFLDVLLFVN